MQHNNLLFFLKLVNNIGQESSKGPVRVNWETFNEETISNNRSQSTARPYPIPKKSSPEAVEEADSLQRNNLGHPFPLPKKPDEQVARRTPPPLPKPYSCKNVSNLSK